MWLIRDCMKEAVEQMQNDPELNKQRQKVEEARSILIKAMSKDEKSLKF